MYQFKRVDVNTWSSLIINGKETHQDGETKYTKEQKMRIITMPTMRTTTVPTLSSCCCMDLRCKGPAGICWRRLGRCRRENRRCEPEFFHLLLNWCPQRRRAPMSSEWCYFVRFEEYPGKNIRVALKKRPDEVGHASR